MKYTNANKVLPKELIEQIQEYVQGEYVYIPIKDKVAVENVTDYQTELEKRDAHIYKKYLEGVSNKRLAQIYHLSESSIRRIIIKQRKGYTFMNEKISKILFRWGIQKGEEKQIYDTTWQIGERYVLKVYQSKEMLERNLKVLQILADMDIPVGKIVLTCDKDCYVEEEGQFYFLSEKLSGKNVLRIGDNMDLAVKMGEIIADLHIAFKKCENADTFWNNSLLEEMKGWIKDSFEVRGWRYISREEYEMIVDQLEQIYDKLPVQLIHRDVHFGNFLFEKGEFSGYIDFDLSQRNIRIFDLCYFMLGLLSEKEKFELTEDLWFEFLRGAFAGYEKKLTLSEEEKQAVPYVMEGIELLFVSYFEGIDDVRCAESAFHIFEFVKKRENRIWVSIK
ncbi:MAG: phosphotransferase [Agathobacter sp.]|nr:phosphotransferase [Agathobacter sp.]